MSPHLRDLAIAVALTAMLACGRFGYESAPADSDAAGATDAPATSDAAPDAAIVIDASPAIDASPDFIQITTAGVWATNSELRRTLETSVSRQVFTFATWYRSDNKGSMLLGAGVSPSDQSFLWAGSTSGVPFFQHTGEYAASPDIGIWPFLDQWVHLVIAVDLTLADPDSRVRWWVNGIEYTISNGKGIPFAQGIDLHLGDTVRHTLGNKWSGGFDWTGSLAETYLIWGVALDPTAFVARVGPETVRSIRYTGPVTDESLYLPYVETDPGKNGFAGQPDWASQNMSTTTTDLPN